MRSRLVSHKPEIPHCWRQTTARRYQLLQHRLRHQHEWRSRLQAGQERAHPVFKDGLPAPEQKVWDSPWGKIGICICYDLSYTRVTDALVRQGAQMLIVPTMDVETWGQHQHELHARIAPVRAAEYGILIFRVASSGISQGSRENRARSIHRAISGRR